MKLWLLSQTEMTGYDVFDSCVVAAETAEAARLIHPDQNETDWRDWPTWATHPDNVTVVEIGTASAGVTGVICASFNAG